jgi:hypothetical protein
MSDQTWRTGRTSSRPQGIMASVIDTARENPIGAALVGMGIAWFFAGSQSRRASDAQAAAGRAFGAGGSAMTDMARSAGDAIGNAGEYVTSTGASAARQAVGVAGSAANRASEAFSSAADRGGDFAASVAETLRTTSSMAVTDLAISARSQFGQLLRDQPLLLAAGAFAIGAAMAASAPLTETEERVFGDAAENAMRSGGDSVEARLRNAAAAAKEEASRQGLTPDALKTEAADLRDRVTGAIGGTTGANSPPA